MTSVSKRLLFGTAGIPQSTSTTSTLAGIKQITQLKLDCLEVEFVRGVKMGNDTGQKIREAAKTYNISLSAHAPYYVNLNSNERGKRLSSQERLLTSARMAKKCGAKSLVFHPGYYGSSGPEETHKTIKEGLKEIVSILRSEMNPVILRPETMGKRSQFGSLEEILILCREVDGMLPCVDFSHIHAREGKVNSYIEFNRVLKKIEKKLGKETIRNMHIHISGVEYNSKGELKHLNLKDSDFRFENWIQALTDIGAEGMVICESPNLEQDAKMLKVLYRSYVFKT
ncbi:MAG: TIM barrel protein [Candidatus Aminicenantes bacterium]|nr:TIM barrel protein [Candidatus Aminicenantes bacterium]MBL7083833.1 TIM barrel protein [Candidatus Aminicenantes bacterium]